MTWLIIILVLIIVFVIWKFLVKRETYKDVMKIENEDFPENRRVISINALPPRDSYCW